MKFRTIHSVDTSLFHPLNGSYLLKTKNHEFLIKPCKISKINQVSGIANFVLEFDLNVDPKLLEPEFRKWERFGSDLPLQMKAGHASISIARDFVAWLSCATRSWIALSHHGAGETMGAIGPTKTVPTDHIKEDFEDLGSIKILHRSMGKFEEAKRPDFRLFPLEHTSLKLPTDFLPLTRKLFSMIRDDRERFLEACASYLLALQNMVLYPTVSLISFCVSVESLLGTSEPQHCEYKGGRCEFKRTVGKKFKQFFRDHVPNAPDGVNEFIGRIYRKRSNIVHGGLLWKLRGPSLSIPEGRSRENNYLEMLVNIALLDWLQRARST